MAPPKAAQVEEAVRRGTVEQDNPSLEGRSGGDDLPADTTRPDDVAERGVDDLAATLTPPSKPIRRDPREAIVARFREDRGTSDAAEDAAELRQFAHDGVPPELRTDFQPEPEPEVAEPDDAPRPVINRKVKVRGQEVDLATMSEDDIVAAAMKGLAGDSYFDEGRRTADEAKARLEEVNRLLAQRGDQGLRAPAVTERPGTETADTSGTETAEHPEQDLYEVAAQDLQYKDPKEAGKSLRTLIESEVTRRTQPVVRQTLVQTRTDDELARSKAVRDNFVKNHDDIAKDPIAVSAIQEIIKDAQLADLRALGFEDAQLPKTREEIGKWHLHYRGEGMRVSSMETLLNSAVEKYQEWKGVPRPAERPREGAPRVEARIDRSERRTRVPQQPSRAAVPQRTVAEQPQQRDRSAVVAEMVAQRRAMRNPPPRQARQA